MYISFTKNTERDVIEQCKNTVQDTARKCEIHNTELVKRKYRKLELDSKLDSTRKYRLEELWVCEMAGRKPDSTKLGAQGENEMFNACARSKVAIHQFETEETVRPQTFCQTKD